MQHLDITPVLDFQVTSAQTCTIWAVSVHFARQNWSRHKRKANMHQNDLFISPPIITMQFSQLFLQTLTFRTLWPLRVLT